MLRSKTRICDNDQIEDRVKFPVLLPNNHHVTDIIIMDTHEEVLHSGANSTLNRVRLNYWILKGRQTVTKVVKRCSLCKFLKTKCLKPTPIANLPEFRVCSEYPFQSTGLDFAGPLYLRNVYGAESTMHKGYILLFTCATTRAIHLELTPDMGVPALIRALQRFFSRKGYPEMVISDNFQSFKSLTLKKFLRENNIKWQYILELAPWWGGAFTNV